MKSRFHWNMAFLYCSEVFFESSRCSFQSRQPVYQLLRMWQWALDEWFTLPFEITRMVSWHTPTSPNLISLRDDDSSRSISLMKRVVLLLKDPPGLIWQMIVAMQKWFTRFNLFIQDFQYLAVQLSREGYASSQSWFHRLQIRHP